MNVTAWGAIGVILLCLALVVLVPIAIIVAIVRAIGGHHPSGGRCDTTEVALIQEIHRGLGAMEKRIENLETIVLEKDGRAKQEQER